jgi:hypothetical protein
MKIVYKPKSNWHRSIGMTGDKIYEGDYVDGPVYSSDGIFYSVVNDNGIRVEIHEIHESNVIELDKVRQDKLNKLGI